MKREKQILLIVAVLAVLIPLLTVWVPAPTEDSIVLKVADFRLGLASTALFAWLYIGAAILFMVGLGGFKEQLKRSYRAICFGLILAGIATLQIPMFVAFHALGSEWVLNGGLGLPFVAGSLMIFLGLRLFAKVLGDKSLWTSATVILSVTLAATLLVGWLARDWSQLTFSNVSFAASVANVSLAFASLVLALRIRLRAGPAYTKALAWFSLGLLLNLIAQSFPPLFEVLSIPEGPVLAIPFAMAGALLVSAGYAFNKIREY